MKNKFSIAMSLAMIVAMLVTSFALAAELVTAEVTGTGNDVTVTQGTSVTSSISLSATGAISCGITSGSPSTATVDTSYSLNSSGALTTGSPSSAFKFYSDGVPQGGNCGVTWDTASTPYSVTATFSAAATTPIGNYTVTLQDSSAGTTDTADVTNPSIPGGKLGDATATTIIVHVVAPVVTDSTPPVITKTVTGTLGNNSWYTGNVLVDWTVSDPESSFTTVGCVDTTISSDTSGTTLSCSATSAGGTSSDSVAIKRDATVPTVVSGAPNRPADNGTWYNQAVDVVFSGTDATSGIASCTSTNYSGPDGSGVTVNGSCTDNAGNTSSSVASSSFNYDGSGPTGVVLTVTAGTPGSNGWYTSDVTVHTSSDADISGVTCTLDQSQTSETAGTVFNGSCTNGAGLTTNAAPLTVKLDKSGPSAALAVTAGTPGNNGWYTSNVTVSTSGNDSISGPASCTVDQFQNTETAGTEFNGSCTNDAGLSTNAAPLTIKLDKTVPSASASAAPAANGNGWNNTDVTVSFTGTDALSGIDSCDAAVVLNSEGAGQSASGDCTDKAGNVSASATATGINIDKTAPTASASASPAANVNGWNNSNVTVSFTGTDALSSIDSCDAAVVLSSEAAGQSASGTCTDKAGNVSTPATASGINIDKTNPTVSLVGGPANGASYYFGSVPAAPTCSASDVLSGLAAPCSVSGYSAALGTHTVTASATDKADNSASASATYTVLAWTINGFYQPVDMFDVLNTVKGGSTVPLKFEVFAGSTELTNTAIVSTLLKQVTCNATVEDTVEVLATGGTSLRYDTVGGQFIYNWQTPKLPGKCYSVTLTTQDGSSITALFKLK